MTIGSEQRDDFQHSPSLTTIGDNHTPDQSVVGDLAESMNASSHTNKADEMTLSHEQVIEILQSAREAALDRVPEALSDIRESITSHFTQLIESTSAGSKSYTDPGISKLPSWKQSLATFDEKEGELGVNIDIYSKELTKSGRGNETRLKTVLINGGWARNLFNNIMNDRINHDNIATLAGLIRFHCSQKENTDKLVEVEKNWETLRQHVAEWQRGGSTAGNAKGIHSIRDHIVHTLDPSVRSVYFESL